MDLILIIKAEVTLSEEEAKYFDERNSILL